MDETQFWEILDRARPPVTPGTEDDREWFRSLKAELLPLPPEEILEFRRLFDDRVAAAYKIDLWGAGYLINGGCSDDGFHYFRCWLVGQGKAVYQRALENPDTLADILTGDWPCEASLDAAPARAWEERTGRTDKEFYEALGEPASSLPDVEEGEDWDFDDDEEMRRRFPRLSLLYLDTEEPDKEEE